jgi:hypothetical protein
MLIEQRDDSIHETLVSADGASSSKVAELQKRVDDVFALKAPGSRIGRRGPQQDRRDARSQVAVDSVLEVDDVDNSRAVSNGFSNRDTLRRILVSKYRRFAALM